MGLRSLIFVLRDWQENSALLFRGFPLLCFFTAATYHFSIGVCFGGGGTCHVLETFQISSNLFFSFQQLCSRWCFGLCLNSHLLAYIQIHQHGLPVVQQVKDLALSLKRLGLLLWLRIHPWPGNFHMPQVQKKNVNTVGGKATVGSSSTLCSFPSEVLVHLVLVASATLSLLER